MMVGRREEEAGIGFADVEMFLVEEGMGARRAVAAVVDTVVDECTSRGC